MIALHLRCERGHSPSCESPVPVQDLAESRSCRGSLIARIGLVLLAAYTAGAMAQGDYPTRPMKIISPTAPGGPNDTVSRVIGQKLTEAWGQPVVIENRAGANGLIGSEAASRAPADGYTMLMANDTGLTMLQHAHRKLPYNPETDFRPVTLVIQSVLALVVHSSVPANSMAELIALARSKPGEISYGSGLFTPQLMVERFSAQAGIKLLHVAYKGASQSAAALLAGHVNTTLDALTSYVPHIGKGRFRIVAVTGTRRDPLLPEVPTFGELGFEGHDSGVWLCLVVPSRTPAPVVAKLNQEIVRILGLPEVRERLKGLGSETIPSTPEYASAFIRNESAKWAKVIQDTGIRLD